MLALVQEATNQGPEWLVVARTAGQALQGFVTALGIIIGGLFAYYKFFRQGEHDPRLQPNVTAKATIHDGVAYIVATVTAQNTGQVNIELNLDSCVLLIFTTSPAATSWRERYPAQVFGKHKRVQPGETLEDQAWIEIPYEGELGVRLDLTVAGTVLTTTGTKEVTWDTVEIVSLLLSDVAISANEGTIDDPTATGLEGERHGEGQGKESRATE
jgi:hypothetical protein